MLNVISINKCNLNIIDNSSDEIKKKKKFIQNKNIMVSLNFITYNNSFFRNFYISKILYFKIETGTIRYRLI